jgi:hypothetical protein
MSIKLDDNRKDIRSGKNLLSDGRLIRDLQTLKFHRAIRVNGVNMRSGGILVRNASEIAAAFNLLIAGVSFIDVPHYIGA